MKKKIIYVLLFIIILFSCLFVNSVYAYNYECEYLTKEQESIIVSETDYDSDYEKNYARELTKQQLKEAIYILELKCNDIQDEIERKKLTSSTYYNGSMAEGDYKRKNAISERKMWFQEVLDNEYQSLDYLSKVQYNRVISEEGYSVEEDLAFARNLSSGALNEAIVELGNQISGVEKGIENTPEEYRATSSLTIKLNTYDTRKKRFEQVKNQQVEEERESVREEVAGGTTDDIEQAIKDNYGDGTLVNELLDMVEERAREEYSGLSLEEIKTKKSLLEDEIKPGAAALGGEYSIKKRRIEVLEELESVYENTFDVNYWNPFIDADAADDSKFFGKVGVILGAINVFGVAVSVITIMVIGIRFMVGSVEQRAEYKQLMMPWIIGAILVFSVSTIPNIIYVMTQTINK